MSGSSRSLSRSIASVFDNWTNNKDWDKTPSKDIKDLNGTIYAYKERHNQLAALNSSLNSEIRNTYSKFVEGSSEISKELLFLDILTRLSPVLSEGEVKLWLATYLLPAIDSTGFDTRFSNKAREFIRSVMVNVHPTDDPQLSKRRLQIAVMVATYILRIYLGTDQEAYSLIGLEYKDYNAKNQDSHENIERMRFMEGVCGIILAEFGSQHPHEYFVLLNTYFCMLDNRLEILNLIASFVSTNSSHTKAITKTPLLNNLLRCLLMDKSETVVACALSALLLLMGRLCDQIATYLSELFLVYSRLILWSNPDAFSALQHDSHDEGPKTEAWLIAEPDKESIGINSQLFDNDEFDLSYFSTLLYAFFPINLIAFRQAPNRYFRDHQVKLLNLDLNRGLSQEKEETLSRKITKLCEPMRLHPNLMAQLSSEEELRSPIKWILEIHKGQDISEDDIMLECLKLNTTFLLWLPDNFVWPKEFHEKVHEAGLIQRNTSSIARSHSTRSILRGSHWYMPGTSERSSNRGSVDYSQEGLSTPRHTSIIPSSMLSEKSPNEPAIKFKNVDYTRPKGVPENGSPKPKHPSQSTNDSLTAISELFQSHEKLYKMSNVRRNSQQHDAQNISVAAAGNFQPTTKNASALLNEQLKGKKDEEVASSKGGALDFYQRELLLYKNELAFTLYIKYLNKLNFIKLKTQLHELTRESGIKQREPPKSDPKPKLNDSILASLGELKRENERVLSESKTKATKLSDRIAELSSRVETLTKQLQESQEERDTLRSDTETYKTSINALKADLSDLRLKIKAEEASKNSTSKIEEKTASTPEPNPDPTEYEKELISIKTELEMARSRNNALQKELTDLEQKMDITVRGYEKQVANLKLDLGGSIREHVAHYEKRIQELKATISRFSIAIEEKNSIITQLSTSRPIQIPGEGHTPDAELSPVKPRNIPVPARQIRNLEYGTPYTKSNKTMQEYIETRSSTGTSVRSWGSTPSVQGTPKTPQPMVRQSTSSSIPIMKGRGGYQKRSKRM